MSSLSASHTSRVRTHTVTWLAGVLFLCFVYFVPRWNDWNQNARLDLTLALVNHHSVAIDDYHWNTGDDVYYRGHYYMDKAPGQSVVGVPVFLAYKAMLSLTRGASAADALGLHRTWKSDYFYLIFLQYLESIYTVAVPGVLMLLLFYWFLGYYSESAANRVLLTLSVGLASDVFPYSQVFFSHIPCAALLFVGFVLVHILGEARASGSPRAAWFGLRPALTASLAGLALGSAVLFDYPAAVISVLVALYAAWRLPVRNWPFVAAGAVPAAAALACFNYAVFHDPLKTAYSVPSHIWKVQGQGLGGTGFSWPPQQAAFWGMTFNPYRGLFFLSPFLLLAIPGYVYWWRRGGEDRILFLLVPPAYFVTIAMFPAWFSGSSVGPRYLIPMLLFLATPIIFVLDRWQGRPRLLVYALLALSAVNVWVQTLGGGGGYPAPVYANPLFQYSLTRFVHGDVPVSLGTFMLAPLTGVKSIATIMPLLVFVAIWTWRKHPWVRRSHEDHKSLPLQASPGASR